ncbi:SpaA isopeptide-forming pilin-related protein [Enterococcus sp. AZ196]|uniref:SpaA isopeptide-forming pilin-related protein n=1 Tax=Enterococcus sp. AZ196 TaxID=2774659 RepID=UPI003D2BC3D5
MKLKHVLSLLLICMAGLVWTHPTDVVGAETQVHLHKRLFVNQEVPSQINQGGALGNADLLKDSYGVNGSTFAIFEVGEHLRQHVMTDKSLSFDQAKEYIADEVNLLRNELEILATPTHTDLAAIQARYPKVHFVQTKETARGSYTDSSGNTVTEDGLLSVTLSTDKQQVYLIVELDSGDSLPVDHAGLSSYLVLDSGLFASGTTHVYTKNRAYIREPYFVKMAKETDGTTKPLAGASFVLSKNENGEKFYLRTTAGSVSDWLSEKEIKNSPLKDERVKKILSDQEGIVRPNLGLKSGSYLFEEVATIDGYEISEQARRISVEIPKDPQQPILINGTEVGALSEKDKLPIVYNQRVVGRKSFQKVDEKSGDVLKDASFVVVNKEMHYLTKQKKWVTAEYGNKHTDELLLLTSNDQGVFELEGMPYGSYSLLETKAPEGYFLPENHFIDFEINEVSSGTKEPLKIVNKKGENKELPSTGTSNVISYNLPNRRLPQTGMTQSVYLLAIGFICVLFSVIVIRKRKRA